MSLVDTGNTDFNLGGILSMQYMPAIATAFSAGLKSFGLRQQGDAMVEAAGRRQQAAEFEAQQLTINAGQAKAASQRAAYFKGLEGERLMSAIQARAGAGASDPTVLNIIAGAMAQKSYNMQSALYSGEEKARAFRMQAAGKKYDAALGMRDAQAARRGYRFAAMAPLLNAGAKSLYDNYFPKEDVANTTNTSWPDPANFDLTRD